MSARPILLSIAFDAEANDVTKAAVALAKGFNAPLVPMHAIGWRPIESAEQYRRRVEAARSKLLSYLSQAIEEGLQVMEPIVERARPAELTIETASVFNAQFIVVGGGGPATVRRWVLGSTAEKIVRASPVPVYLARGQSPQEGLEILCPIDLSAQSRVGLTAALRFARAFRCPLTTLTILPEQDEGWVSQEDLSIALAREEEVANGQVQAFLDSHDLSGVDVRVKVMIGNPAARIVEASDSAGLMVLASRGFTNLTPGALGGVTERSLRFSRCSALTVRDPDPARESREESIKRIAGLKKRAELQREEGKPAMALSILELAIVLAPANPTLHDAMAELLDELDRGEEAAECRRLAVIIRDSFA